MLVVDFIAGPGVGKSSLSLGLASALKMSNVGKHFVVEYLPEFAKKLVWQKQAYKLKDRFWSVKQQSAELDILCKPENGIDIVVFDGSLVLDSVYANWSNDSALVEIEHLTRKLYLKTPTLSIKVVRNSDLFYEEVGRLQTQEQAQQVDGIINYYIDKWNIETIQAVSTSTEVLRLRDIVLKRFHESGE